MRKEYIKSITKLLEQCHDIELIDFIHQLLQKRNNHLPDAR